MSDSAGAFLSTFSPHGLQLRSKLTMEKVYLALDSVGLMGEKNKLENDCRHGASELKITEVSVSLPLFYTSALLCA